MPLTNLHRRRNLALGAAKVQGEEAPPKQESLWLSLFCICFAFIATNAVSSAYRKVKFLSCRTFVILNRWVFIILNESIALTFHKHFFLTLPLHNIFSIVSFNFGLAYLYNIGQIDRGYRSKSRPRQNRRLHKSHCRVSAFCNTSQFTPFRQVQTIISQELGLFPYFCIFSLVSSDDVLNEVIRHKIDRKI